MSQMVDVQQADADSVWVTPPSEHVDPRWESPGSYHSTRPCAESGAVEEAFQLSVREAQKRGYTPCGRCL